jgi:hypothetical protein
MKVDLLYLLMASFAVIGLIEWVKAMIAAIQKGDGSWKWPVASLIGSALVAFFGDGGTWQVLTNFVVILAINEVIGYKVIVQTVNALIDKLTFGASVPTAILTAAKNAVGGGGADVPPPASTPAVPLSKGSP